MNERIERLMTRRLDGELSPGDSLELDKYLIREPAARDHFAELQRADCVGAAVVQRWCAEPLATDLAAPIAAGPWWAHRWVRFAAAACLVLWTVWPTLVPYRGTPFTAPAVVPPGATPNLMVGGRAAQYQARDTRVDWVYDPERQAFYLIETRRHSAGRPRPASRAERSRSTGVL